MTKTYIIYFYDSTCISCYEVMKLYKFFKHNNKDENIVFRRYNAKKLSDIMKVDRKYPDVMDEFQEMDMLVPTIFIKHDDILEEIFMMSNDNYTMEEKQNIFLNNVKKIISKK